MINNLYYEVRLFLTINKFFLKNIIIQFINKDENDRLKDVRG